MKISGKCLIAKKYKSDELDFQSNQKVGWGRLTWVNNVKDVKTYTTKKFAIFDNIEVIENNLGKVFDIQGILRTEEYEVEGEKKKAEKIIINQVTVYENVQREDVSIAKIKNDIGLDIESIEDNIPF